MEIEFTDESLPLEKELNNFDMRDKSSRLNFFEKDVEGKLLLLVRLSFSILNGCNPWQTLWESCSLWVCEDNSHLICVKIEQPMASFAICPWVTWPIFHKRHEGLWSRTKLIYQVIFKSVHIKLLTKINFKCLNFKFLILCSEECSQFLLHPIFNGIYYYHYFQGDHL